LGGRLGFPPTWVEVNLTLLVVPGGAEHFGVVAGKVEGFFGTEEFVPLALPLLLEHRGPAVYNGFDLWRSELLIAGDASRWGRPA